MQYNWIKIGANWKKQLKLTSGPIAAKRKSNSL